MPIKIGSRLFAPRPFTSLVTLLLLALLLWLGRWQLQRADEKRVLFDSFARGADATQTLDLSTPALPRYQHVEARGHYDSRRQVLIDNRVSNEGRAGYEVITPFELERGGWVLVDRGWLPVGETRAVLPAVTVGEAQRTVLGRADHLPAAGIKMGNPAALAPPFPVVANFPDRRALEELLHETQWSPATEVILLDADQADGYRRDWQPPGFPPLRHLGYAVQWFGLALALTVLYAVTSTRRLPSQGISS